MKKLNLVGQVFSRLTVIKEVRHRNRICWECVCICGNVVIVWGAHLKDGHTKSCSCLNKENNSKDKRKHGHSGDKSTTEYNIWCGMKARCYNPKEPAHKNYGARGIKMCDRWLEKFENFLADMGMRPSKNHSIDRIDNNGNYEPSNCRWATWKQQAENTRKVRIEEYGGMKMNRSDWARKIGIHQSRLSQRLKKEPFYEIYQDCLKKGKFIENK